MAARSCRREARSSWKGNWGFFLLYKARLSWCERHVEVTYVLSERLGNDDCREEEGTMVVLASRGAICWVLFAGNVSSVEMDVLCFSKGVDLLENFVCGLVTAPTFPPALNDSPVVPKDFDVRASGSGRGESKDAEPEANPLCPTYVPAISFPT